MLSAADQRSIEQTRTALRNAVLAGDAEAYVACFAADAFVMHQDTPYVRGWDAIREHTEEIFQLVKVSKLELSPVHVSGLDTIAYEVGVQEVAIDPPVDAFKAKRKYLHVYERQVDETWKIVAAMSSND